MSVWEDGSYSILHYEIASVESEATWSTFFDHLIARKLDPEAVTLVVSDGTTGLPAAMAKKLPHAQQQRCVTHKLRGIERYLTYQHLPQLDSIGQPKEQKDAKRQRRKEIQSDAYKIYQADNYEVASLRLIEFVNKWESIEPDAVRIFGRDIQLSLTFYQFDTHLHSHIRTTNNLERLFREFRAKSDEIGAFPMKPVV